MAVIARRNLLRSVCALPLLAVVRPVAALPPLDGPTFAFIPEPPAPEHPWRWWISSSGGESYFAPCATREEAVAAARRELAEIGTIGGDTAIEIAECRTQSWRFDIDSGELLERLESINEDRIGEGDFLDPTPDQLEDLERSVEAAIAAWALRHGLDTTAWIFGEIRNHEDVPAGEPVSGELV